VRTLVLSVGNTSVFGGIFRDGKRVAQFRVPIVARATKREVHQHVLPRVRGTIDRAVFCSVVPVLTGRIAKEIGTRFGLTPQQLTARSAHGLKIAYRRPQELGTDRIAAALGARAVAGSKNVIVVDCGTATTVTALSADGVILGGAIFPGLALWSAMLASRTAQLPEVQLQRPRSALGRSTREGLQSGIFHGHTGAVRELVARITREAFRGGAVLVVGTGGNAAAVAREGVFSLHIPDLVLLGLNRFANGEPAE
jgi:type III pantothenate kinase